MKRAVDASTQQTYEMNLRVPSGRRANKGTFV